MGQFSKVLLILIMHTQHHKRETSVSICTKDYWCLLIEVKYEKSKLFIEKNMLLSKNMYLSNFWQKIDTNTTKLKTPPPEK